MCDVFYTQYNRINIPFRNNQVLSVGSIPGSASCLSVGSLHVLPTSASVLSKDAHIRLIGDTKLSESENVSVHGCLSLCVCVGTQID